MLDADGNLLWSEPGLDEIRPVDFTRQAHVRAALSEGRPVVSGAVQDVLPERPVIFLAVPRRSEIKVEATLREQLSGLKLILTNALFWRVAPLTMTAQAALLAEQTLWAGPWLSDVARLPRDQVATDEGFLDVAFHG